MTLTQLRTFLAVADTGSVRAAAARLVVSQPSVSAAVSSLERELGVALVARQGRGLRLTDGGAAFAATVRSSLGLLDQGVRSAQTGDDPGRGSVRLAAVTTAAERLLPRLLASFRRAHPDAGVSVEVLNRARVWEALVNHEVDLAVAGRPPAGSPLRVLGTAANRLIVVGPPARGPRRRDLGAQTWLLREEGSGTRSATDALLDDLGIQPATMVLGSNGAIEQCLLAGLGITLISEAAVAHLLADGSVAEWRCPGAPLDRPWHVVAHRDERLPATAALLLHALVDGPDGIRLTTEGRRALRA
jgi:DNA-binding transcriptional LysR family regulator